MATVVVSPTAADDLAGLIRTHSLPANTLGRVTHSLHALRHLPRLGASLEGRWAQFRFILGPWRWMIVVYACDEEADRVAIVTIQDGRSARAPTAAR